MAKIIDLPSTDGVVQHVNADNILYFAKWPKDSFTVVFLQITNANNIPYSITTPLAPFAIKQLIDAE